ncbi:MAG: hypothetical protein JNK74_09085 [Candidatus Hydrogenedentes bacterium]|nr:hypothetical protein [Candidatus Hydrogenedentota bacterium]
MEGIKLGFRYASVAIRVEILERRRAARATGTTGSFHAFGTGAEIATGRRTLTEITTVALRAALHAPTFGATVKFTARRRTLTIPTLAAFGATGRTITFAVAAELTTGWRTLTEVFVALRSALHGPTVGATIKFTAGRRTLTIPTLAAFGATGRTISFAVATELTAGWRTLTIPTLAPFGATGRAVAFAVALERATGRRPLAITMLTTFRSALFGSGELRVTIATAGALPIPPHFRARIWGRVRAGPLLGSHHAAQTDQAKRAETAGKKHRRPDTALLKESFAAHLAILLTVRRALSASWVSIPGGLPHSGDSSVLRLAQL